MASQSNEPTADNWAGARGDKWHVHLERFEAMLAPVDEPLMRGLDLDAPYRIADVGCGGGGTAFEILAKAPAGTTVDGFDLSPKSVEAANGRAAERKLANVARTSSSWSRLVSSQRAMRTQSRA